MCHSMKKIYQSDPFQAGRRGQLLQRGNSSTNPLGRAAKGWNRSWHQAQQKQPPLPVPLEILKPLLDSWAVPFPSLPDGDSPGDPRLFEHTLNTHCSCTSSLKRVTLRLCDHPSQHFTKRSQTCTCCWERRAPCSSCGEPRAQAADPSTAAHAAIKSPLSLWEACPRWRQNEAAGPVQPASACTGSCSQRCSTAPPAGRRWSAPGWTSHAHQQALEHTPPLDK